MKRAIMAGWLALLVGFASLAVACGEEAAAPAEGSPQPVGRSPLPEGSRSQSYPEGTVSIDISMLDVGLLKGDAAAEAKDGWLVAAIKVTAADHRGASWAVLEFPEGVGSRKATEFFEVQIQELPRGDQLEIAVTATFEKGEGERVERQATDRWPP